MTSRQNTSCVDAGNSKGSTTWRFATITTYPGNGARGGAETQAVGRTATRFLGRPRRQIGHPSLSRRAAQAARFRHKVPPMDRASRIPLKQNDSDDFALIDSVDVRGDLDVSVRVGH